MFLLVWAVLLGVARIEKRACSIYALIFCIISLVKGTGCGRNICTCFRYRCGIIFIYSGLLVVEDAIKWDERSETTLRTPFWILYLALSVSFTAHMVFIIERLRLLITTGESAKHSTFT